MKWPIQKRATLLSIIHEQTDSSLSNCKQLIKQGLVFINNHQEKRSWIEVDQGSMILLKPKPKAVVYDVTIPYYDRDLIIVDKPHKLLSVAEDNNTKRNVHQILKDYFSSKIGVVHRLDRDSSGLLLFSRSERAYSALKKLFSERQICRRYIAIHKGSLKETHGQWKSYLQQEKNLSSTSHSSCGPLRKLAITHYRLLQNKGPFLLMEHLLETGRKHQIRVHAATNGIPIIGDKRYQTPLHPFERLALHAYELTFIHPFLNKSFSFISPIPSCFTKIIEPDDKIFQIASHP